MVDRDIPTPLYRQIADAMAARIANGELRPRHRMPSEVAIQVEFGVSRGTARKAIEDMRKRNLIVTLPRSGHYAVEPPASSGSSGDRVRPAANAHLAP